jgi:hypothetical protein
MVWVVAPLQALCACTGAVAMPSYPTEVPGGVDPNAPLVGCTTANRSARANAALVESCEAVSGRCLFVAPDGNDSNPGTFAAPLRRPHLAVKMVQPGDVIYLRGGVYDSTHSYPVAAKNWSDSSQGTVEEIFRIGRISMPSWAGGESWHAPSGTPSAPITIKSFPGERACLEQAGGVHVGSLASEIAYWHIEDLTFRVGKIRVGGGSKSSAGLPVNQVHHIRLKNLEIFDGIGQKLDNTGLITVDRGDWGGPYEIAIESNILHDLRVNEPDGVHDWTDTTDAQHFGAVTTLSCESYIEPPGACGGNGRLTVRNNLIYNVPSALFFKNPTLGPVVVERNVFHPTQMLGKWAPSNITFEGNRLWDTGAAASIGGFGGDTSDPVYQRSGRNLILRYNTFIGRDSLLGFSVYGSGHTIQYNVIEGLSQSITQAHFDTPGYLSRGLGEYTDTGVKSDITTSELAVDNVFNDNCLVTSSTDFIAVSRYLPRDASGNWQINWLTLAEARATLGFETRSVVAPDKHAVFVDYDGGDYTIDAAGPCAGMGADGLRRPDTQGRSRR